MKSRLPALMMPLSVASEEARAGKEVQARAEPFKRGFAHAASDAVGVNEAAQAARSGTRCHPGGSVLKRGKKRFG